MEFDLKSNLQDSLCLVMLCLVKTFQSMVCIFEVIDLIQSANHTC